MNKERAKAALGMIMAMADAIRELKEVPSGVLYSKVMETISLEQYQSIIETLKRTGLVKEENFLLKWVEPK